MKISEGLRTIRRRLNGHCSNSIDTCPEFVIKKGWKSIWTCDMCVEMFKPLGIDLTVLQKNRNALVTEMEKEEDFDPWGDEDGLIRMSRPCPCQLAPEIALARLDESILEYEAKGE